MFHGTYYKGYATTQQPKEEFPTLESCNCCYWSFWRREKPKSQSPVPPTPTTPPTTRFAPPKSAEIPVRKRSSSVAANASDSPTVWLLTNRR